MFVQPFFTRGIAHSSYLLAGSRTCAVVDPGRDARVYVDAAREMGFSITHILETHLHADFISGHRDLAEQTGATIYAPKAAKARFPHVAVREGSSFSIDDVSIRVMETPGHTPEHVSYVVTDRTRGKEPVAVFCGDTLFVGDVGRPDLFPGMASTLAGRLYESLHKKLLQLPEGCMVYPAHGAGSLCGRSMGAMRSTTIGYEKRCNPALCIRDRKTFIASLTTNMPPPPDHFSRCSEINAAGPILLRKTPILSPLAPAAFKKRAGHSGVVVLDTRGYEAYGGSHVPGSYNIDLAGNFATFAGWVLPPRAGILLVSSNEAEAREARQWLQRVGFDRVTGFLEGGMFEWAKAGLPSAHLPQCSVRELHELAHGGMAMQLVDVRSREEYEAHHMEHAIPIPAPALRTRYRELDPALPVILLCSTGYRSSLAASLLEQRGFKNLMNVAGGMSGYKAAGFTSAGPACRASQAPRLPSVKHSAGKRTGN